MPQTVIYGPPATGKTFHAAAFAKLYDCDCVADDHGGRGRKSFWPITSESALILSTSEPADLRKRYPAATLVRIDAARSALGLDPAPVDGFKPPYHDKAARPPVESAIGEIDLDADMARKTLARLSSGFTLTEAAKALSVNAPHRTLRALVTRLGFQPYMERRGHTMTRCYYPISKEARAAQAAVAAPVDDYIPERLLSYSRIRELLDYATVYGEFDENTPIGTRSTHDTVLTEGQLHAIFAYKKVLGMLPVDVTPMPASDQTDRASRMEACPCACHENRCGSADIAMAQYALALVARCSNADEAVAIHGLVERAGPDFARRELEKLRPHFDVSTDEEAPF